MIVYLIMCKCFQDTPEVIKGFLKEDVANDYVKNANEKFSNNKSWSDNWYIKLLEVEE